MIFDLRINIFHNGCILIQHVPNSASSVQVGICLKKMGLLHSFFYAKKVVCLIELAHKRLFKSFIECWSLTLCRHANAHLLREWPDRTNQLLIGAKGHPVIILKYQLPVFVIFRFILNQITTLHHGSPNYEVHQVCVRSLAIKKSQMRLLLFCCFPFYQFISQLNNDRVHL